MTTTEGDRARTSSMNKKTITESKNVTNNPMLSHPESKPSVHRTNEGVPIIKGSLRNHRPVQVSRLTSESGPDFVTAKNVKTKSFVKKRKYEKESLDTIMKSNKSTSKTFNASKYVKKKNKKKGKSKFKPDSKNEEEEKGKEDLVDFFGAKVSKGSFHVKKGKLQSIYKI